MKFKYKEILFLNILLFFFILNNIFAQEISPPYIPRHWQSFTELPYHLTSSIGYIGRFYQYSDLELYFKDSNTRLQKISDKEVYHLECYGAIGDGTTNDSAAFSALATNISDGGILCLMNKTYYINTSGSITFNNKINIIGPGTIKIGSGVGNNPALIIAGDRSYLSDFEIIGDHTNFANANFTTELRRSIKITADYVTCNNLVDTNSIVGIELNTANHCTIKDCVFINDIVMAGPGTNNYHCAIRINSGSDNKIIRNRISGYGNGVLHGGSSYRNIINNNQFYRPDNNSIYISSGQWAEICGNIIRETDDNGIKARDSYHLIYGNLIDQNSWTGGLIGIGVTGNGTPDSDGFNGEGTLVIGNIIKGKFTAGIRMSEQDDGYHKNPVFINNVIEMTGDPNVSLYGIHVKGRTENCVVSGNSIKNAVYGVHLTIDDPNNDYHYKAQISNNSIRDTITYGILAVATNSSVISDNEIGGSSTSLIGIYTSSFDKTTGSTEYTVIKNNHIKGIFNSGIYPYIYSGRYLQRLKIINNEIEILSGGAYGIRLTNSTDNCEIINNNVSGHTIGIYISVEDPNTEEHNGMLIQGNNTSGGTNDGISLSYVHHSLITDNISINASADRSGITLVNSTYNELINNMVGDNQDTATQKYGIEEQGTSDYNIMIDNECEGLTNSGLYRYAIVGSNSLVETNRMIVETLSDNRVFEIGEGRTFVLDPGGAARNLNPRNVTWPMINELLVINTADNAETITFDSLGLNQAINQNERGIFVFDGSNWLKVYVGS